DYSVGYKLLRKFCQSHLDRLSAAIAVSNSTTVALERYFSADWQIIPNGIDTDVFHPNVPAPPGMQKDVPNILFLGRFDPRNALADALVKVLDDPGLAIELGTTGRQRALDYSWARVTSQVLDVYSNVLGHVPAAAAAR